MGFFGYKTLRCVWRMMKVLVLQRAMTHLRENCIFPLFILLCVYLQVQFFCNCSALHDARKWSRLGLRTPNGNLIYFICLFCVFYLFCVWRSCCSLVEFLCTCLVLQNVRKLIYWYWESPMDVRMLAHCEGICTESLFEICITMFVLLFKYLFPLKKLLLCKSWE